MREEALWMEGAVQQVGAIPNVAGTLGYIGDFQGL